MKDNRLDRLKRILPIGIIAYRKEIRKFILKVLLMLNMIMFIIAFLDNMPSMVLYLLNVFYLYQFMKNQYPVIKVKEKERYQID